MIFLESSQNKSKRELHIQRRDCTEKHMRILERISTCTLEADSTIFGNCQLYPSTAACFSADFFSGAVRNR